MSPRRELPVFRRDDCDDAGRLNIALNDFSQSLTERLAALESCSRVAVLDEVEFETGGTVGVNVPPFPLQMQTPFSVAGAWLVSLSANSAVDGIADVVPWVRPVPGGLDGQGAGLEVVNVTGLAVNTRYRMRLAVVGVKNG